MRCPFCGYEDTKVIESRLTFDGFVVRRRRECPVCGARFTTYERYELGPPMVVKRDGRRERFSREKILRGVMIACEKRPIPYEELEKLVDRVILRLQGTGKKEVETKLIGEYVLEELKKLDEVAYVRFASVYRDFKSVDQFLQIITELKEGRGDEEKPEEGLPDERGIRKAEERARGAQAQVDVRDKREDKGGEGAR